MAKRINLLLPLLFILVFLVVGYFQYIEQKNDFLKKIDGVHFEFDETLLGDSGTLEPMIKSYSDATMVTIPLRIDNTKNEEVFLEKVVFKIYIVGNLLEERIVEELIIPSKGSKALSLDDVKISGEKFDTILLGANADVDHPEDATLELAVEVYIFYPLELGPIRIDRFSIQHVRLEGDIHIRSLMGGRTKEEAAVEFL